MRQAFSWMDDDTFEECCANTEEIADKCNVELSFIMHHCRIMMFPMNLLLNLIVLMKTLLNV